MDKKVEILILEDNSSDVVLAERELRRTGLAFHLEWAQDKAAYQRALEERVPDIVLADYSVPGFDGLAALEIARRRFPNVPVVIVSGALGEEAAIEALKGGATDYVLKDRLGRLRAAVLRALQEGREMAEKRRVALALRETEERMRLVLQASATGWWYWDFAGEVLEGDDRVKALLGLPAGAELTVERVLQQTVPEDRALVAKRMREFRAQAGDYDVEFRTQWNDGSRHWLMAKGRSYGGDGGGPVRGMGIAMEITDRKEAEQALNAASAAKDQFLAVLSHELRTPLAPVLAAVNVIERKQHLTADLRHHLEVVRRNVELEARLIDDLLDLTRIAQGKIVLERQPVEMQAVLTRVVEVCKPDIENRKLHFGVHIEGPLQWVHGDVGRLQQIFWNLLKNAIKFTPDGGCIGIRGRCQNGQVMVEVTDSGIGIEPEALTRIFAAFEQADQSVTRQFGGLGLGLAISKRLVEMHGGSITAVSRGRGRGAVFRVILPRYLEGEAQAECQVPVRPAAAAPALRRILLVEDHGDTALMMRELLESSGFEVQTAGDVSDALEVSDSGDFDLLISDLGLPDRSGLELMHELRNRGRVLKGIALSGFGREDDIKKSRAAGFIRHLTKPVDFETLLRAIAQAAEAEPQP